MFCHRAWHVTPAKGLGHVVPHHEFYTYEAKYLDENGASFALPAQLPLEVERDIRNRGRCF